MNASKEAIAYLKGILAENECPEKKYIRVYVACVS